MALDLQLAGFLQRAVGDPDILAVVLFGSVARGQATRGSDVDICLVMSPGEHDRRMFLHKRLEYASRCDFDVQVFQSLPLHVRIRILKEGKLLFVRDEQALYELAHRTVRAFENFKPHYRAYLDEVLRAGS